MFSFAFKTANRLAYTLRQSRLLQNLGWMTATEMVGRVGRIVTAIILARTMDMVTFGIAAMAITVFELTRIFTENGIGAAVIRAPENKLIATTNTAYKLMWIVCALLAVFQAVIGLLATFLSPDNDIGLMIFALSIIYLVMPWGLMHAYMLMRQERMKRLAIVSSSQTLTDHILTAILALSGFGAWSIILPKILTTPIWLVGVMHGKPWRRDRTAGTLPIKTILRFSVPVLLSELAVAMREQLDKALVFLLFGIEALGLYYFAFNAGLGLSTALNRALNAVLYPNLCAQAEDTKPLHQRFRSALFTAGGPLACIYFIQSFAALIYVPLLFGDDWAHAAPLVAILCLGGPARMLVDSVRMYWRASGVTTRELKLSFLFAVGALTPIPLLASAGLAAACLGSVIGAMLISLSLSMPALKGPDPSPSFSAQEGLPA